MVFIMGHKKEVILSSSIYIWHFLSLSLPLSPSLSLSLNTHTLMVKALQVVNRRTYVDTQFRFITIWVSALISLVISYSTWPGGSRISHIYNPSHRNASLLINQTNYFIRDINFISRRICSNGKLKLTLNTISYGFFRGPRVQGSLY